MRTRRGPILGKQAFLPGLLRGGAAALKVALARVEPGVLTAEVTDRIDRVLGAEAEPLVTVRLECPSCGEVLLGAQKGERCSAARRANVAATVERLIPRVPVRHWVLSLPTRSRVGVAEDDELARMLARTFVGAIFETQRKSAARRCEAETVRGGAVTVLQRGGSALNLDVHVHAMVLDGVYAIERGEEPVFHPLPEPEAAELEAVAERVRQKLGGSARVAGPRQLTQLRRASVEHRVASGPEVTRVASGAGPLTDPDGTTFARKGLSVHAASRLEHDDRRGIAQLARYLTRAPIEPGALEHTPDGKVRYRLKAPFADGTTHVEFSPEQLAEKLVALVPDGPSRRLSYYGVLAPAAADRRRIVVDQLDLWTEGSRERRKVERGDRSKGPPCPRCRAPMRVSEVEEASDWVLA